MKMWCTIKSITDSKLSASSALWIFLVPIIAKVSNTIGVYDYDGNEINLYVPISFLLLYFSAVTFFIAGLLYKFFCPELIKNTLDFTDFKNKGMNALVLSNGLSKLSPNDASLIISEIKNKIEFCSTKDIDNNDYSTIEAGCEKGRQSTLIKPERLEDVYWIVREYHNSKLKLCQFVILSFYFLGGLMLSYILIDNLVAVVKSMPFF